MTAMTKKPFLALPGVYGLLFRYVEPVAVLMSVLMIWIYPGASWFHQQLVPSSAAGYGNTDPDIRSIMAIWQLSNCYFSLSLVSAVVFRTIRDTLVENMAAQERIVGAFLLALGIADVTHVLTTLLILPSTVRFSPLSWNGVTHGNITITFSLFLIRLSWYLGIGRTRYYFRNPPTHSKKIL